MIVGCMVWWLSIGFVAFGFALGGAIVCLWISQNSEDLSV